MTPQGPRGNHCYDGPSFNTGTVRSKTSVTRSVGRLAIVAPMSGDATITTIVLCTFTPVLSSPESYLPEIGPATSGQQVQAGLTKFRGRTTLDIQVSASSSGRCD